MANPTRLTMSWEIGTTRRGKQTLSNNEVFEIKVEAVPAYNINKDFHTKAYNGVGFIIEIDNTRLYHAGDTDLIPEMNNIKNIDIAFLPVSGKYVMTAEEAASAASLIKPRIVIPMHWGAIIGTIKDANNLKKNYNGKVEII